MIIPLPNVPTQITYTNKLTIKLTVEKLKCCYLLSFLVMK